MGEVLFCVAVLAGVIALGMYKAPLWLWAAALAVAAIVWQGAVHGSAGIFGYLMWSVAIALGFLSVPAIRRALVIAPAFKFVSGTLPKVSDTEEQALEAGTVGFDAELFSGTPDWNKLHSIPPIVLTSEEQAFLDGPTEELCRMLYDWQMRHTERRGPARGLGLRQAARLPRHAHLQGARRAGLLGAGAVADHRQDRLALARRRHRRHGAELARARRADREVRHRAAEVLLPAAARPRRRDPLLLAHRADVGLGRGDHARHRHRHARRARRRRRHPAVVGQALHHARTGGDADRPRVPPVRPRQHPRQGRGPRHHAGAHPGEAPGRADRPPASALRAPRSPMAPTGARTCSSRSTG